MRKSSKSQPKTNGTSRDAISPDMGNPPTAAPTKTKPARVSHAKSAPARELPTISAVKLLPLDLIDIEAQVRTVFDDESIQRLANDIAERGLLQPVLVNPHGNRFTLIAGERRVRACKLLGLTDVPALVTKASTGDALLMQLAENIQREELDLNDQVKAIRRLHDSLGTVAAVADTIKKSPAWVSKRLALSHEDLAWQARRLMEENITEDVEILTGLSTLSNLSYQAACKLEAEIRQGKATRDTVRAAVKAEKESQNAPHPEKHQQQIDQEAAQKQLNAEAKKRDQDRKNGTGPAFIHWALHELQDLCTEPDEDYGATHFLNDLKENQRNSLELYLSTYQKDSMAWNWEQWARMLHPWESHASYLELYVALMATKGQMLDGLYSLVTILETANKETEE